jgi:putative membrane protein
MDGPVYRTDYYADVDARFWDGGQQERARHDGLLATALKGAAAGVVGTAAITLGMHYGPTLMQRAGLMEPPPPGPPPEEPTEKLAAKVTDATLHSELDETPKQVAGQAIHWGYGALWGALYGVAERELRWPVPLAGAALGTLVGAVASTAVPAMGLTPPPTEQPVEQTAMMSALHVLYGEVTALTFHGLE